MNVDPHWTLLRTRKTSPNLILDHFDIIRPPVDVEAIACAIGIEVVRVAEPGWLGAVKADESSGRAVIWLDANDSPTRQKFTIAHEMGHLLRHTLQDAYRDVTFNGDPLEIEANRFAGDILMPFWMLHPVAFSNSTQVLARAFSVSESAMEVRLRQMVGLSDRA